LIFLKVRGSPAAALQARQHFTSETQIQRFGAKGEFKAFRRRVKPVRSRQMRSVNKQVVHSTGGRVPPGNKKGGEGNAARDLEVSFGPGDQAASV